MITLTPSSSPAETDFAHALLDVIRNPDLAQKHLDRLTAEKLAAEEATRNLHAAQKQAADDRTAAEAALAEAKKTSDEFNRSHAARTRQIDEQSSGITAAREQLKEHVSRNEAFEQRLNDRETQINAALDRRESDVKRR